MLNAYSCWLMFSLWAFAEGHPITGCIAVACIGLTAWANADDSPAARLQRAIRGW